ncbi:MAG: prolyl oligopeptidase family serine peptidase [Propionibacteriaceae bacterium]|nr:prolyl oligopeptidase family serine peptidase [Propionibacteriaceae bacterium]
MGLAEDFAAAGVLAVAHDKRPDYDFLNHRDFEVLASDANAVIRAVRTRPDVDAARVGLWGISEGGRVAPTAAARSSDASFVISVSGPLHSQIRNTTWSIDEGLAAAGAPDGLRGLAARTMGGGRIGSLHQSPPPEVWRRVRVPALIIYGTRDVIVPPREGPRVAATELVEGGNAHGSVRWFADADHGISVGGVPAPGYLRTMTDWIHRLPDGTTDDAPVAGQVPLQRFTSAMPPPLPWYAGAVAHGVTLTLLMASLVAYAALSRGGQTTGERAVARATLAATTAFVAWWVVIALAIASGYSRTASPVILNVGWGVARALALAAGALLGVAGVRACQERTPRRPDSWLRLAVPARLGIAAAALALLAQGGAYAVGW